jgi:membrane-anchored mycosin MYCP
MAAAAVAATLLVASGPAALADGAPTDRSRSRTPPPDVVQPPQSPGIDPPPGLRPGPAPGVRAPAACTPPAADPPPAADHAAERLQLAALHRLATGAGQVVAVIDTGVHPDARFGDRLRGGGDYVAGGDGLADCDGHGTAVAGLIGAARGDRDGAPGIAPAARLVSIRQSSPSHGVPGPDGAPRPAGDVETLADAVVLAVRAGAGVVNISEAACLPAERAAVQGRAIQAALRFAARADVVVVAAAGNAGVGSCAEAGRAPPDQVSLPGWYGDDVLTVGAVGPDDAPAAFTVAGPWVDVAAPGTGLRSLAVGGGTTGTGVEGTSFAAPWVAGLAALVRERFPRLTAAQVTDRILATARRAPGGHGAALGHGVVDPLAALTAVPDVLPGTAAKRPAPTAALPVTAAAGPEVATGPADLLAAGMLLTAGAAAPWLLRRRPGRG